MDDRWRCQCSRWPSSPCDGRMTQEDLLCVPCRDGCPLITIAAEWSSHVKITSFAFSRTVPPSQSASEPS